MPKDYGKTVSGVPITEELIEELAAEAERGFDVDEMLERRRQRESQEAVAESSETGAPAESPPPQP
jgi:hypothetical protein